MTEQTKAEVELLTSKEAAAFLKLSESFLAKARMRGDGPRYRKLSRTGPQAIRQEGTRRRQGRLRKSASSAAFR